MRRQHVEMGFRREVRRLARLRREVDQHKFARGRRHQSAGEFGNQQVRNDTGEPRAGTEHDPVGIRHGGDRLGARRRPVGHERDTHDAAGSGRDLDLAPNCANRLRVGGEQTGDLRFDVERDHRHRQHAAVRPQQPPDQIEGRNFVTEQLVDGNDQQIAEGVIVQVTRAFETMLHDLGPGAAPRVVTAQRRERHAQIARREHAEFFAQPAA